MEVNRVGQGSLRQIFPTVLVSKEIGLMVHTRPQRPWVIARCSPRGTDQTEKIVRGRMRDSISESREMRAEETKKSVETGPVECESPGIHNHRRQR